MSEILLSTTGVIDVFEIEDLDGIEIIHPTTDLNLLNLFSEEEIKNSKDLQTAINNNYITLKNENGTDINNFENIVIEKTYYYKENLLKSSTTSNSYKTKLELTHAIDQDGFFKIDWFTQISIERKNYPIEIQILLNDMEVDYFYGNYYYSNKDYWRNYNGSYVFQAKKDDNINIKINYRSKKGRRNVYIKNVKLLLYQINIKEVE